MKPIAKPQHNRIHRDLLIVLIASLVAAISLVSAVVMLLG
jgi:Na+-transporting NADH:ubiquinone oxidoreductase subunit NqrC